jgi:hypothetical protein
MALVTFVSFVWRTHTKGTYLPKVIPGILTNQVLSPGRGVHGSTGLGMAYLRCTCPGDILHRRYPVSPPPYGVHSRRMRHMHSRDRHHLQLHLISSVFRKERPVRNTGH